MERSGSLLIGGIGIGTGYFIYSMATNIVMFYIGSLFVGVFPAFCSSTTTGAIVNRWFGNLNTTLLSISVAKGGFGGTLGFIIVGRWLGSIGYVSSFRYMAILIVAVMVVVSLLVRNSPQDKNTTMLWVSGQDKVAHSQENRAGYTIKQAVKTYNFWAMAAFFALNTIAFYAAYANVSLHMADLGWSPELYGTIFSFANTANVIAIFVGGYATDKLGPRITIFILCVLYAVICTVLGFMTPSVGLIYVVCCLIGVCWPSASAAVIRSRSSQYLPPPSPPEPAWASPQQTWYMTSPAPAAAFSQRCLLSSA